MNALLFLTVKKAKNRIKEMLHRPSELIIAVIFIALLVMNLLTAGQGGMEYTRRDIDEFYAIVFAVYALVFLLSAKTGFVNGASMFSMADVNLLFTAPFKQKRLLSYGLLSQLGRSLMIGVFLVYQYPLLNDTYGIHFWQLLVCLVGYGITVFLSQMLAMLIYSVTASDDKKCRIGKFIFYGISAAFFVYLGLTAYNMKGELLPSVVAASGKFVMNFFPIAGFVKLGVVGLISGNLMHFAVGLICVAAFILLYYILVSVINADYYEDVLKATEVSFSAITARKEGKVSENAPRKVKVGKIGLPGGEGASAIAAKHKVENRRSRVFLLDMTSVIMALVTIGFTFIMKESVGGFAFSIYISLFVVATGRWAKELLLPYVYLIPEKPFKKLLYMLRESIGPFAAEAVITFVPFIFLVGCSLSEVLGMIAAKVSFSVLFVGVNLILQRFFGNGGNKALVIMLYFMLGLLFSVPSAAVLIVLMPYGFVSFFAAAAVNAVLSLIVLFLSRNVLEVAEYNNK